MEAPTVWILGGVDKGNDYNELLSLVNEKVKAIICLGNDNEKIKRVFENTVDIFVETQSMGSALDSSASNDCSSPLNSLIDC